MTIEPVEHIASLLRERHALDGQIGAIIQRLMPLGHLGEWIVAQVFGIELVVSAVEVGAPDSDYATPPWCEQVPCRCWLKL
jgi:hypothetical protein